MADNDKLKGTFKYFLQKLPTYFQRRHGANLLDNPWFQVNQHGVTGINARGYICDRWYGFDNTAGNPVNISWRDGDGVFMYPTGNAYIRQQSFSLYDKLAGKTITLSVKTEYGTYSKSAQMPTDIGTTGKSACYLDMGHSIHAYLEYKKEGSNNMLYAYVRNQGSLGVWVRAVKLEEGDVSTLANDTAPVYEVELLKCQRYYVRFSGAISLCVGGSNGGAIYAPLQLTVPMAGSGKPTITGSSINVYPYIPGATIAATSFSVDNVSDDRRRVVLVVVPSNLTNFPSSRVATVGIGSGGYLALSSGME